MDKNTIKLNEKAIKIATAKLKKAYTKDKILTQEDIDGLRKKSIPIIEERLKDKINYLLRGVNRDGKHHESLREKLHEDFEYWFNKGAKLNTQIEYFKENYGKKGGYAFLVDQIREQNARKLNPEEKR